MRTASAVGAGNGRAPAAAFPAVVRMPDGGESAFRLERKTVYRVPSAPGVYCFEDSDGDPLYVGNSRDLRMRMFRRFFYGHSSLSDPLLKQTARAFFAVARAAPDIYALESSLLRGRKPKYARIPLIEHDGTESRAPYLRGTRNIFVGHPYGFYDRDDRDYRAVFSRVGKKRRVDFLFANQKITNDLVVAKIRGHIRASDFSIFDLTGWNPNVAFELGMAHEIPGAQWRICFNPEEGKTDVPSNMRGIDRFEYRSFAELEERLDGLLRDLYPVEKRAAPEELMEMLGAAVLDLFHHSSSAEGLRSGQVAEMANINPEMSALLLHRLKEGGKIIQRGRGRAARYFLKP